MTLGMVSALTFGLPGSMPNYFVIVSHALYQVAEDSKSRERAAKRIHSFPSQRL